MIWWEKTVEYYFIQNVVAQSMPIAPLDGNLEKAGDAIFAPNNRWILIEFKRREESVHSEKEKFEDYYYAYDELAHKDDHHLIIYGKMTRKRRFGLIAHTYFTESLVALDNQDFLSRGVRLESFTNYLSSFLHHKSRGRGSGAGNLTEYMMVTAVNKETNNCFCMTLEDFGLELEVRYEQNARREKAIEAQEKKVEQTVQIQTPSNG